MARIKLQNENVNDPEIQKIFNEIKTKTGGKIPAAYRAFGRTAHILAANWNRTKKILGGGKVPVELKESIALAVSSVNGCGFCVAIHRRNLAAKNFSETEIGKIERAESTDKKTDFILKFCVTATKTPAKISDADFAKLREFGFSDEEILEILTTMEMYTGYNKIIVSLDLQIDD